MAESHPRLARLKCEECQKFVYDIPQATPQTFEGANGPEKIPRAMPPPCSECPKGSPENEHLYQLSWKNHRAMTLYKRVQSGVLPIPKHLERCPLLADIFTVIGETLRVSEKEADSRDLAMNVTLALARSMSNVRR